MFKRLLLIISFMFALTAAVFADGYTIRSYSFDISGKTQERVVRKLVVPSEKETFSSLEEVVDALDEKKQALLNKRVFTGVSYTFTEVKADDTVFIDVLFDIDDAKTSLILPYPKYDSNFGVRLGLKYRNSNVLGTFAGVSGVFHVTLMPWNFSSMKYYTDVTLTDLLIGDTSISLGIEGTVSHDRGLYEYDTDVSVKNIMFGRNFSMDLALGVEDDGYERFYNGYTAFKGLHVSSVTITPSLDLLVREKRKLKGHITPALNVSGIRIGKAEVALNEAVRFVDIDGFGFYRFNHDASLSFTDGKLSNYGYSNALVYKIGTIDSTSGTTVYIPGPSLEFDNTLSYRLSDVTTLYIYENLTWKDNDLYFRSFDTGVGISQKFTIGEHITLTPTLSEFVSTSFDRGDITPIIQPYYVISASSSGDYINWKGNFRDGVKYSFSIKESWWQNYSSRSVKDENLDTGEIQIFKVFWNWFNPSLRIIANYANNIGDNGFLYGTDDGDLGEYIRGVRNSTIKNDGRDKNIVTLVANLNLMAYFPLPSFMNSWMDAYVNVFADYVFTKHGEGTTDENIARSYFGFGIEGIGIIKDYPSYPVRASLGFDLRKLMQYVSGESKSLDFYELYVGIDFFF